MGTLIVNQYLSKLWTPAEMTTALWLDAADSSTLFDATSGGGFPGDGGTVRRWEDKSGNGRHYSLSVGAPTFVANGLNGLGQVVFNGSQCLRRTDSGFPTGDFTIAYVGRSNLLKSGYMCVLHYGANVYSRGVFFLYGDDSNLGSNGLGLSQYGNAVGIADSTQSNVLMVGTRAGTTYSLRKNGGASVATRTMATDTVLSGFSTIGAYNASLGGGFLNGFISNLILINGVASTQTIEKLEGHLSHKRGLAVNLPSNHPYKNNPPYV